MNLDWEMIIKMCGALLCGLLIGIDRQLKQKPLGVKTSMVICIASCLVTIVSIEAFNKFAGPEHPNMDPMRLAAQIVSGIGFLGAGVILRRNNDAISGLTSAAMIWAASGLGIAIGAGFYIEAAVAVVLLILAVNFVPFIIKLLGPVRLNKRDILIKIVLDHDGDMTEVIRKIEHTHFISEQDVQREHRIRRLRIKDLENGRQQVSMVLTIPEREYTTKVYYFIRKLEHVHSVEVEQL
ncbi:methyltransferase [Paenibacillus sp. CAA11]|uniref:MgtC/SapB family protein n=1 Tax=Paenibacillus sp. CAA11 TaxID=1532905 RepID=UPI000D3A484E|nr:MgtC/SapB family protein [Paenibacillus sp. CAA11]AWB44432.1 methyltransferase [Paenibacillus sp. CAA11]